MDQNTLPSQGIPLHEQLQIEFKKQQYYLKKLTINARHTSIIIISSHQSLEYSYILQKFLTRYLRLYFILYLLYSLLSAGIPNFPNDESLTKFSCESAIIFSQKSSFNINIRTSLSVSD